jgi:SpoVK/Ycf46/Vps4 family AAA+-type ATPase
MEYCQFSLAAVKAKEDIMRLRPRRANRSMTGTVLSRNGRFVRARCAAYLRRALHKLRRIDEETLAFLAWLLGPDIGKVGRHLATLLAEPQKAELLAGLEECLTDPEEYSRILLRHLGRSHTLEVKLMAFIQQTLEKVRSSAAPGHGPDLERNMNEIKSMFRLTDGEAELCILLFLASGWRPVEEFFDDHLQCFSLPGRPLLAAILQVSPGALKRMFRGTLPRLGILGFYANKGKILLDDDYVGFFEDPARARPGNFFTPIASEEVPLDCHLVDQAKKEHVLSMFRVKPKAASAHLLLYGPPGTGKTSFARGIAASLTIPAYEITRGDGNTAQERRTAIRACLNMTNSGDGSIVLVDEADNVLNTRHSWLARGETQDKGWLNELLEEPGVRMIWVTNDISDVENSVLRRFAFSMEFKPFSRRQRMQLWEMILRKNKASRHFAQDEVAELADRFKVSAGAIDLAVKKARELYPQSKGDFRQAVALALEEHKALLTGTREPGKKEATEKSYSLEGLNVKEDLPALMARLATFDRYLRSAAKGEVRNMNLLFYGPPGTGKSELARHIAERLDRELLCKRVSDLFDPYVGMTERRIRDAFAEAEAEEAVLVIDEADSLLFSRDRAVRSWEVSFTNEFLTRMERFRGILICTTNRLGDVDSAAMRRFNHKVEFKYLTAEGNVIFYRRLLCPLTTERLTDQIAGELRSLSGLAPGHFKVVRDRFQLEPAEAVSHPAMVRALWQEAELKGTPRGKGRLGF